MCGCEMLDSSHDNSKEHQLERILSENLRMMPDKSEEVDKYGLSLHVDPEDDDLLHAKEHRAFIAANTLRPQYKAILTAHAKKHDVAHKEKERMGLLKVEKDESAGSDSQDSPAEY